MSPSTPPSPLGSGQASLTGIRPKNADDSQAAPNQAAARLGIWSTGRLRTKPMPQKSAGTRPRIPPRPKNCMMRSAKLAPAWPSTLLGSAPFAFEKLGSLTFQVDRATAAKASEMKIAKPPI